MKRRSSLGVAVGFAASMAFVGSASAAFTGLTNGSFEDDGTYVDNLSGFQQLDAPNTSIDGWSVDAGSVDWIGEYWTAPDGDMSIDMSGANAGTLSQSFETTIGNTYTVVFHMSGNPAGPPSVKTLEVSATGGTTGLYTHDTTGTDLTTMAWTSKTYTFLATSANTTLTFTSTTAGAFGPAIDAVAVTEDVAVKDDCKNGGWESMLDTSGNGFKNQGDCVSFFATKGKNLGAVPAAVAPTADAAADSSSDKQATKRAEKATAKSDRQTEKAGSTKTKAKGKSAEHRGSDSKSKKPKK
ncbi:MAG TPA: choice-of-anchor C family protein [Candidatus Limnocylindrales bacterium]|nr:choice-of-anchor C family protein [Candidatus Limnocylindrales bacterium]